MTQILQNASHPGSIYAGGTPHQESLTLQAGDTLVFNGSSLQVLATGKMSLLEGVVEVAHVQLGTPVDGAPARLDLPASLARKLADHLGIAEGTPYQLQPGDAELINQVASDNRTFQEAAAFVASLTGATAEPAADPAGDPGPP